MRSESPRWEFGFVAREECDLLHLPEQHCTIPAARERRSAAVTLGDTELAALLRRGRTGS
jgi:hypothetical protein